MPTSFLPRTVILGRTLGLDPRGDPRTQRSAADAWRHRQRHDRPAGQGDGAPRHLHPGPRPQVHRRDPADRRHLGGGRDEGLAGIAYKLFGPLDGAKLNMNPISATAPGIFRRIFEYNWPV